MSLLLQNEDEDEVKLCDALSSIIFYNGYFDEVQNLKKHIEDSPNLITVNYPKFLPDDCNTFIRIFWSLLVLMYGEYGTSPRFGWLNNKVKSLEFIDRVCKREKTYEP